MSNTLEMDVTDKNVVLSSEYYQGDESDRTFHCTDGFGCFAFTRGQAIFGQFVKSGEKTRIEGFQIEKLA